MSPVSSSQPVDTTVSRIDWGVPQKIMLYVMRCPLHGGKEMAANHRGSNKKKCTCDASTSIMRGNTVRAYRDGDTIKLDLNGSINDPNCKSTFCQAVVVYSKMFDTGMFNYYATNVSVTDQQHGKSAAATNTEVLYALESTGPRCEGCYLHWDTTTEPYTIELKVGPLLVGKLL